MTDRPSRAEIMDDPRTDPREITRAFRFIRWTNRRLRGREGLLTHLESRRRELGPRIRLLDVGTGCCDIPIAALAWAEQHGIDLEIVAVDSLPASLADARREIERAAHAHPGGAEAVTNRIELVEADAFSLFERFGPRSFDVVHAGMFLHHFTEEKVVRLLGIMGSLAKKLVIWNDLIRDRASRVVIRVLTLPLSRIVRHDAVLSVDKGFRIDEAAVIARRAGLGPPEITQWVWAGRFSLAASVEPAANPESSAAASSGLHATAALRRRMET